MMEREVEEKATGNELMRVDVMVDSLKSILLSLSFFLEIRSFNETYWKIAGVEREGMRGVRELEEEEEVRGGKRGRRLEVL